MNATKNHIGKNQVTGRKTTRRVTSTIGQVRSLASKTKDLERNSERQTEVCTNSNASNGFLKCKFLPKQEEVSHFQGSKKILNTERDFYKSLSKFSKQYGVEPMQTKDFGFPYNLALAMWDIKTKMKQANADWNQFKLIRTNKKFHFAKEEQFCTNTSLYFIPVVPLFKMLHDKMCKKNAQLLLSVFSYLYHIANVPYYRQQASYLYWIYEMHEGWMEEDEAGEDSHHYCREFEMSKNIGDKIERKIFNIKNLDFFEQRLKCFKIQNEFDIICHKVASEAFALYSEYPNTTIFRNKPSSEENPHDDDYSNKAISMDMYISFVANTKGCLYNKIEDSINAEFNEYGSIEEPTIYLPINGTEIPKADFDFEYRLFALMEKLHQVLTCKKLE
ncbi:hypothetical protein [Chryseobacterium sp.]|uniref:hypothetical protein n=1 Tax=Chryseobacterium sp. TaxID=1871047 RepID=UPI0028972669|nr:hypothetical protein [Chryseobacterium sp.]